MNMKSCRPGFTLIELLVVVAIIALLISILLPSLSEAKEQAKTVKCVANFKEIGIVMHMYFTDHKNWFPYEKSNEMNWMHGFYYGGHPGRRAFPGSEDWWGFVRREWRDTPAGRPFNTYFYPELPNWDVRKAQEPTLFEKVRDDLRVFECPSDTGGWVNTQPGTDYDDFSTYYLHGNSYDFNYHYVMYWALDRYRDGPWQEVGNAFLNRQREQNVSTFIALYEDPFDVAQWNRVPRRGWHQRWNTHSFLFLDGHAKNMFTDTTKGNRGPGWKTASGGNTDFVPWWEDPDDPDYEYRNLGPS